MDEKAYVAFLPIGLMLIIPLRNSMNVPLQKYSIVRHKCVAYDINVPLDWNVQVGDVMQDEVC